MLILTYWLITVLSYQLYLKKIYFTDTFRIIMKLLLAKIRVIEPFSSLGHAGGRTVRSEKKHTIYEYCDTSSYFLTKPKNISSISFSFTLVYNWSEIISLTQYACLNSLAKFLSCTLSESIQHISTSLLTNNDAESISGSINRPHAKYSYWIHNKYCYVCSPVHQLVLWNAWKISLLNSHWFT